METVNQTKSSSTAEAVGRMAAAAAQRRKSLRDGGSICQNHLMIVMTYIKLKKTVGTSTLGRLATNGHASGSFISPKIWAVVTHFLG